MKKHSQISHLGYVLTCYYTYPPSPKGVSSIITGSRKLAIFKTAPRDIPKLKMAIAMKTKEYDNCKTYPERDTLWTELEALKEILPLLYREKDRDGPKTGVATPEKMVADWQSHLEFRRKRLEEGNGLLGFF